MKINYVSTLALNSSLRAGTLQKQNDLAILQTEISSGKKADLGRELGAFSSRAVSLDAQIAELEQIEVTNSFAKGRFSTLQNGIAAIVDSSDNFIGQITTELTASLNRELLTTVANSAIGTLQSTLNATLNGEYVFSGINTASSALVDYNGPDGAAAKAAVQNAFTTHFGFTQNDPLAAGISTADFQVFIDGPFAQLFDDANWNALWSNSSDQGVKAKISPQELVESPTTATATAFRDATAAAVLISEFAESAINESTLDSLSRTSIEKAAEAVGKLGEEQSKIGVLEGRVEAADERLSFQRDLLRNQLSATTDIDAFEAATRLNQLTASLEASYAVTARIQSLSLLNFI